MLPGISMHSLYREVLHGTSESIVSTSESLVSTSESPVSLHHATLCFPIGERFHLLNLSTSAVSVLLGIHSLETCSRLEGSS